MTPAATLSRTHLRNLERYLSRALGQDDGVRVERLTRAQTDARRETYFFDAMFMLDGVEQRRALVLRRDPLNIDAGEGRRVEYAAYRSVRGQGVPTPRPLALVTDPAVLGSAFFVAERVEDGAAASPFAMQPFGAFAEPIGASMFSILGRLAGIDAYRTELAQVAPAPAQAWSTELDRWAAVIEATTATPQPIVHAAIRRLRRNAPPPPPRVSLVHGDYRVGSFLHDGAGAITAVVDWELAHLGDPLEDLAWALDPLWALDRKDLAAGLIARDRAIELWEDASGFDFHPERFRWWSVFSAVKGVAIWLSAARLIAEGRVIEPVLAFSSWYCLSRHNAMLAERLAEAGRGLL